VQQIFTLTTQMEDNARTAEVAYKDARALLEKVKARTQSASNDSLVKQLTDLAPERVAPPAGGGRGGRGGGGFGAAEPAGPANLSTIAGSMVGAVQGMQAAEMAPTAAQLHTVTEEQAAFAEVMAKWNTLKAKVGGGAAPVAPPAAAPPAAGK
jgi:hypothetical protein